MKHWKVEVRAAKGKPQVLKVVAPTRQAAMEQAITTQAKVVSITEWEDTTPVPPPPPPLPKTGATKRLDRSSRTSRQGEVMVVLGVVGVFGGCVVGVGVGDEAAAIFGAGIAGVCVLMLVVGAAYIAIGRLGLDIADRIAESTSQGKDT